MLKRPVTPTTIFLLVGKGNKLQERRAHRVCVSALRRGKSERDEEMHKETHSLEITYKSTSERGKEKHPNMHSLNGLPPFLSLVFPSASFFLSDFISWPVPGWSLAFRLHYSPKARPFSIIFLCLSLTLICLLPSWGPDSSLHPIISGPHLLFFLFLLPASTDQTHCSVLCCSSSKNE